MVRARDEFILLFKMKYLAECVLICKFSNSRLSGVFKYMIIQFLLVLNILIKNVFSIHKDLNVGIVPSPTKL